MAFNQMEYQNKERDKKYDRIELIVPRGMKEKIQKRALELELYNKTGRANVSVYIQKLIEEDLKRS